MNIIFGFRFIIDSEETIGITFRYGSVRTKKIKNPFKDTLSLVKISVGYFKINVSSVVENEKGFSRSRSSYF